MKNLFVLCILTLSLSCDDGDLQIETIDFDSVDISTCESTVTTSSTIFFKISDDEALILELESGVLKNEVSETFSSAIPGKSQLTYRIFSDDVDSDYFCDDIPTATPTVVEEIEAEDGEVLITTTLAEGSTDTYEHTLELSGITFITSTDQRITDLQISEFGVITTTAN
ncbi:hypothetical protein HZY62_20580 [Maribacter polysiphoniae]|uniref:Uncharacterized protein n=1 Tax=Maribacter polysiphoniae TaxID=429344 RepID=A0A316DUR7_9FLAO|nr:hypothetical protein [Maribacter polysiphoniae]MBD1263000.1 hypothetical protein [Maribacter polysiphoniae]PWK22067.1 hypothetical protein LX92_03420 [Maribacter polysiphoniae]